MTVKERGGEGVDKGVQINLRWPGQGTFVIVGGSDEVGAQKSEGSAPPPGQPSGPTKEGRRDVTLGKMAGREPRFRKRGIPEMTGEKTLEPVCVFC